MNKANQLIIDTLKACGCAPAIITDKNGNKPIKVNAPILNDNPERKTGEKP